MSKEIKIEDADQKLANFLKQNSPLPESSPLNEYATLLQKIATEHQQKSFEVLFRFLKYGLIPFTGLAFLVLLVFSGYGPGDGASSPAALHNEEVDQYLAESSFFLEDSNSNRETELEDEDWIWLAETLSSADKINSNSSNFTED